MRLYMLVFEEERNSCEMLCDGHDQAAESLGPQPAHEADFEAEHDIEEVFLVRCVFLGASAC